MVDAKSRKCLLCMPCLVLTSCSEIDYLVGQHCQHLRMQQEAVSTDATPFRLPPKPQQRAIPPKPQQRAVPTPQTPFGRRLAKSPPATKTPKTPKAHPDFQTGHLVLSNRGSPTKKQRLAVKVAAPASSPPRHEVQQLAELPPIMGHGL